MYVKFKGTMTKWHVQKPTHRTTQKHVEHKDATDIQIKLLFCDFRICQVHTSSAVSKYIPDIRDDSVLGFP